MTQTTNSGFRTDLTTEPRAATSSRSSAGAACSRMRRPGLGRATGRAARSRRTTGSTRPRESLHVGHLVPVFGLLHLQRHGNRPDRRGRRRNRDDRRSIGPIGRAEPARRGDAGAKRRRDRRTAGALPRLHARSDGRRDGQQPRLAGRGTASSSSCGTSASTSPCRTCSPRIPSRLRLESGLSFTEFSYMLLQSADFLHLYREHGCRDADGRRRPVGQHHCRSRADPTRGRAECRRPRAQLPLLTDAERREVRQDIGQYASVARSRTERRRTTSTSTGSTFPTRTPAGCSGRSRCSTGRRWSGWKRSRRQTPEARPAQRALAFDITARVHGSAAEAARLAAEARIAQSMPVRGTGSAGLRRRLSSVTRVAPFGGGFRDRGGGGDSRVGGPSAHRAGRAPVNETRITDPSAPRYPTVATASSSSGSEEAPAHRPRAPGGLRDGRSRADRARRRRPVDASGSPSSTSTLSSTGAS